VAVYWQGHRLGRIFVLAIVTGFLREVWETRPAELK